MRSMLVLYIPEELVGGSAAGIGIGVDSDDE